MRSFLKASLLVVMVLLCVGVPIVNAGIMNWTSPTSAFLRSVFMVSPDDGWAVGQYGTIIHWNGTEWSTVTSPTSRFLYSVFMVNADDGWAVGDEGTIVHWNGTEWSMVTSPTMSWEQFRSVFMVSADDGWAVGALGSIIHWDGIEWSNATSPTTTHLYSVFMVSADDGWAVGDWGRIIQWTGIEWIPEFPTGIIMPLLISLTLFVVILAKTAPKLLSENGM